MLNFDAIVDGTVTQTQTLRVNKRKLAFNGECVFTGGRPEVVRGFVPGGS